MQAHEHVAEATSRFLPHGFCYLWDPTLLWSHVAFDLLIGLSYLAISATLVWLVWRGREAFPFQRVFLAFGLFIVACGATHLVAIWTLWNPDYWFSAGVKGVTALASVGTALLLPPLAPRILRMVRDARETDELRLVAARAVAQRESDARYRESFEHAGVGLAHLALDGRVEWANARLAEITGRPAAELTGQTLADLMPGEEGVEDGGLAGVASGSRRKYSQERRLLRPDGTPVWVHLTGTLVRDAAGAPDYVITVVEDVSARREADAALRAAKQAAEAANRTKSEFMATMSHELRTPLGAVIGYTELLREGVPEPVGPAAAQQVDRIRLAAHHLRQLIDDVLGFARLEAGRAEVEPEATDLPGLLREVEAIMELEAVERGLRFQVEVAGAPDTLYTDPRKLRQILLNLLGNALKFTEEGSVHLRVTREDGSVAFHVEDTGMGIQAADLDNLFEPFWQADSTHTRTAGGTGLGLAISRHYATLLGGTIHVESTPGQGSTFTLRLPASPEGASA